MMNPVPEPTGTAEPDPVEPDGCCDDPEPGPFATCSLITVTTAGPTCCTTLTAGYEEAGEAAGVALSCANARKLLPLPMSNTIETLLIATKAKTSRKNFMIDLQ